MGKAVISGFTAAEIAEICAGVSPALAFKVKAATSKQQRNGKLTRAEIAVEVETFTVDDERAAWGRSELGVGIPFLEANTALWRDHLKGNGYKAGKNPLVDVAASWRNWMRRSADDSYPTGRRTSRGSSGGRRAPLQSE